MDLLIAGVAALLAVALMAVYRRLLAQRRLLEQSRVRLDEEKQRHGETIATAQYRKGYSDGAEAVRSSLRYEREIFESRRTGVLKRETVLKVRERVMLDNMQIAEFEREVVLASEVDTENVWRLVDTAAGLLSAPGAEVVRRMAPGVQKLIASKSDRPEE